MKKTIHLNLFIRILLALYLIMAFALGVYFVVSSLNLLEKRYFEYDKHIASYNIKQSYFVELKQNTIYDNNTIEPGKTYISSLVKSIPIRYEFDLNSPIEEQIEYQANIYATLSIYHRVSGSERPLILERNYEIFSDYGIFQENIFDDVSLDFEFYQREAETIINNLDVNARSELKVYYTINIKGENFEENESLNMKIPMLENAFTIEKSENVFNNVSISGKEYFDLESDYLLASLGIFLSAVSSMFLIVWRSKIFGDSYKTEFCKTRDSILKEHGEIIIELVTPIDKKGLSLVYVKNFNEMLDLEEELRIPINYYEPVENQKGEFSLRHNSVIYLFEI